MSEKRKHLSLLLALMSLIVPIRLMGQEPTAEETTQWLIGKLNHRVMYHITVSPNWSDESWSRTTFENGRMSLRYTNTGGNWADYSVALKDLTTNGCKVEAVPSTEPQMYEVEITCDWAFTCRDSSGKQSKSGRLEIYFRQEEMANRVVKALTHLINLSGGKKEPF